MQSALCFFHKEKSANHNHNAAPVLEQEPMCHTALVSRRTNALNKMAERQLE